MIGAKRPARVVAALFLLGGAILVASCADPDALHRAAGSGNVALVADMIYQGADLNEKDKSGKAPLHHAAQSSQQEVVRLLIKHGADIEARDGSGTTPLHRAAGYGGQEVARLLIAEGAAIEARDRSGGTPLHWAASCNEQEAARLLIAEGATIEARDKNDRTPLHWATGGDIHSDIYHPCDFFLFFFSSEPIVYGEEIIPYLVAEGADVNARDKRGQTPLHSSVFHDRYRSVLLLIAEGADIEAKDMEGKTPLDISIAQKSRDGIRRDSVIIDILLTAQAKK